MKPAKNLKLLDQFSMQLSPISSGISCDDYFNPGLPPSLKISVRKDRFVKMLHFFMC